MSMDVNGDISMNDCWFSFILALLIFNIEIFKHWIGDNY